MVTKERYFAVQTDNGDRTGWRTCWYLPGRNEEVAQKRGKEIEQKKKVPVQSGLRGLYND